MPSVSQDMSGWDESSDAWREFVDEGDPNRVYVLDPTMLQVLGDVSGLSVLDVGCGEGRFCRMLASRGAIMTGLDPTTALIESASSRQPEGRYVQGSAENLPFEGGSFDIVVSYVTLCDIADYKAAITEMARVLKPGGRLIVANLNSFASCVPRGWRRDSLGRRDVFPLDYYAFESGAWAEWRGIKVVNYHRPASDYVQTFLGQGLRLLSYQEPVPSASALKERPDMADFLRVPYFVVMEWLKE